LPTSIFSDAISISSSACKSGIFSKSVTLTICNNRAEALVQFQLLLDNRRQNINRDGNPDLCFYREEKYFKSINNFLLLFLIVFYISRRLSAQTLGQL